MTPEERNQLIDQLDRSFTVMPNWVKATVKHALGAPKINQGTGQPFRSFREVIEAASDIDLLKVGAGETAVQGDMLLPANAELSRAGTASA